MLSLLPSAAYTHVPLHARALCTWECTSCDVENTLRKKFKIARAAIKLSNAYKSKGVISKIF